MAGRSMLMGVLGLCGACSATRAPAVPTSVSDWQTLTSEHFVLSTNISTDSARATIAELEKAYWVMANVALPFSGSDSARRINVVVLPELEDLKALGYVGMDGLFIPEEDTLLLTELTHDQSHAYEIVLHELTHRFVHSRLGRVPTWLDEGLAEYYSSAEIGGDWVRFGGYLSDISFGDKWSRGLSDGKLYALVPRAEVVPLEQLKQLSYPRFHGEFTDNVDSEAFKHRAIRYASSWAAVQALHLVPQGHQRFERYFAAMSQGATEERAYAQSYGDVPPAALDAAYEQVVWQHTTDLVTRHFPERPAVAAPVVTLLSQARAQVLLTSLHNRSARTPERERRALDAAVAMDPHDPEVFRARGLSRFDSDDRDAALSDLRRAHALSPHEARYLDPLARVLLLEVVAQKPPSAELSSELEHVTEALRARAQTGDEWATVALTLLLAHGNGAAGRQFAERGLRLDPSCWRCYVALARAAERRRDFQGAVDAQDQALSLMPEALSHVQAFNQLVRYRKLLSQAAPPDAASVR